VNSGATAAEGQGAAAGLERVLGQLVTHSTAEKKRYINYLMQGEIIL
jgi:hypothetical protein